MDPNNSPGVIPPLPQNDNQQTTPPSPPETFTSPASLNPVITPTEPPISTPQSPSRAPNTFNPPTIQPTNPQAPQNNIFVGGDGPGNTPPAQAIQFGKQSKKSIKLPLMFGFVLFLILGTAGFVFGYYIPNKPENVWSTGVSRSGDTIEKIISQATEKENITKLENSQITASINGSADGFEKISGDFDVKFSNKAQDGKAKLSVSGNNQNINLVMKYLLQIPDGSRYPDIFVNISGFDSLGLGQFVPGINNYDGKWISISSKYLESQLGTALGEDESSSDTPTITAQDVSEISRVATKVSIEYVFSTDTDRAVLVNKEFLGKEVVEGMDSYHYKVGINAENSIKYCKALVDQMLANDSFKKVIGNPDGAKLEETKISTTRYCDDLKDDIKPEDTFEVWIDAKYKLINRIRVFDKKDSKFYLDLGQKFTGEDDLPFYADFSHSSDIFTEGRITLIANLKTYETKGELKIKTNQDNGNADVTASIALKPITEEVKITPPDKTILIEELLKMLQSDQNELNVEPVLGANTDDNLIDIYKRIFGS